MSARRRRVMARSSVVVSGGRGRSDGGRGRADQPDNQVWKSSAAPNSWTSPAKLVESLSAPARSTRISYARSPAGASARARATSESTATRSPAAAATRARCTSAGVDVGSNARTRAKGAYASLSGAPRVGAIWNSISPSCHHASMSSGYVAMSERYMRSDSVASPWRSASMAASSWRSCVDRRSLKRTARSAARSERSTCVSHSAAMLNR